MKEFKGTKGVWEARKIAGEINVIVKGTLQTRRSFTTYRPVVDDVGCKHDASLISAAPELLHHLQLMVEDYESRARDIYDGTGSLEDLLSFTDGARKAIAKALGEKV